MTPARIGALRHGKKRRQIEKATAGRVRLYADMQWTKDEILQMCNPGRSPLTINRIDLNPTYKQVHLMMDEARRHIQDVCKVRTTPIGLASQQAGG